MGGGSIGSGNFGGISIDLPTPITFYFNFKIKTVNAAGVIIPGLKVDVTFDTMASGVTDSSGLYQAPRFSLVNTSSGVFKIKVTDVANTVLYAGDQTISSSADFIIVPIVITRHFIVRGKTMFPDNSPLPGLQIQATDKTLGLSTLLAPAVLTSDTGQYEITFWTGDLAARGRTAPNLVIRVSNSDGELLTTSGMFTASGLDEINLTLSPDVYGGPCEFTRFYNIVKDSLSTVQAGGIDAHDLVILSKATSGDISQMNHLMEAIRLSDKTTGVNVAAEWLYGLFRRGLPTVPRQLANVSRARFDTALKDAIDLNIISNNVLEQADTIYKQLLTFKVGSDLVSDEDPEAESMLGYILSCSDLSPDQQATLYLAYLTAEKKR